MISNTFTPNEYFVSLLEELYNCFFNLALYSVKVSFSRGYLLVESTTTASYAFSFTRTVSINLISS